MNHMPESCHAVPSRSFTDKQGQYLAFIHAYTLVMDRPPAEADLQRHFGVTPHRSTAWCFHWNEPALYAANPDTREALRSWSKSALCRR